MQMKVCISILHLKKLLMAHAQKYKLSTAPLKETKDTLCNSFGLQTRFVTGSTSGTTVGDDTYAQLRFQKVTDLLLTSQPKTLECPGVTRYK